MANTLLLTLLANTPSIQRKLFPAGSWWNLELSPRRTSCTMNRSTVSIKMAAMLGKAMLSLTTLTMESAIFPGSPPK